MTWWARMKAEVDDDCREIMVPQVVRPLPDRSNTWRHYPLTEPPKLRAIQAVIGESGYSKQFL